MSSKLFQPLQVGQSALKNRIVLAPLTRFRASDKHEATELAAEYYAQRACVPGTLLITEATFIAPQAGGYDNVPGIYNQAQIEAWKKVTAGVHAKGSFIYLQLWALGRAANADVLAKDGYKVKSSSDVAFEGGAKPEALTEEEIREFIGFYAQAAKNAVEAGFDGVEIHGANGYLVDQFQQDTCNKRTDAWGGSIEKRARFGLEVAKAVTEAIGADRTGLRISPFSTWQGMKMADPYPQFTYFVNELKKLKLAYLHVVESRIAGITDIEGTEAVKPFIEAWGKTSPVLLAGGFKADTAKEAIDVEYKDQDVAMVFGRLFISNPDIVFRLQHGIELTPYDRNTFYTPVVAEGYTTWPFSKEFEAAQKA